MSVMPSSVLQVEQLGIRRSERWLFRDLSFSLSRGEALQVVGKNGAGKTSLLRCLCGLLLEAEGNIRWCEVDDLPCLPLYLGHLPAVKPELTVFENLKYHPLAGKFIDEISIEEALEAVRLGDYLDTPARYLSAGQTRRVGLARLGLADTLCWVLDEPFTSLDVEGCAWLENQMAEFLAKGGSILFTSHQPVNLAKSFATLELNAPEAIC